MSRREKSCGGVVIDRDKVLMIWQENEEKRILTFPKGHMEENETEIETAEREIWEETGVSAELDGKKRVELFYHIEKDDIDKTVVLFAGKPKGEVETQAQEGEIREASWVEIDKVEEALVREDWKKAWNKMREML